MGTALPIEMWTDTTLEGQMETGTMDCLCYWTNIHLRLVQIFDFRLWISDFGLFQIYDFRLRISDFGFQISDFGFRIGIFYSRFFITDFFRFWIYSDFKILFHIFYFR